MVSNRQKLTNKTPHTQASKMKQGLLDFNNSGAVCEPKGVIRQEKRPPTECEKITQVFRICKE